VILFEQQGHGRTADIDRPLDFIQMADDTAAAIQHLDLGPVDVFGYSDGGNVALGLAIRHPDLVRKLGLASVNFNNDGLTPGMLDKMAGASAEDMPDKLKDAYTRVAPRPEDWPVLVHKVMELATSFPGWSIDQLRGISAPSLVLVGDSDIVRAEHAVELFRTLPEAQLAVLPGTGHDLRLEQPDLLLMILGEFFDAAEDDQRRVAGESFPVPSGGQGRRKTTSATDANPLINHGSFLWRIVCRGAQRDASPVTPAK
jgi:pimeloyl-ACP methyl ester carboxylesterase